MCPNFCFSEELEERENLIKEGYCELEAIVHYTHIYIKKISEEFFLYIFFFSEKPEIYTEFRSWKIACENILTYISRFK